MLGVVIGNVHLCILYLTEEYWEGINKIEL